MRERNYRTLIADRHLSLFGHICRLPENTPASQALQLLSIEAHTGTVALLPPQTGSVRRVVHEELGCNKWRKTLACLLVLRVSEWLGVSTLMPTILVMSLISILCTRLTCTIQSNPILFVTN